MEHVIIETRIRFENMQNASENEYEIRKQSACYLLLTHTTVQPEYFFFCSQRGNHRSGCWGEGERERMKQTNSS